MLLARLLLLATVPLALLLLLALVLLALLPDPLHLKIPPLILDLLPLLPAAEQPGALPASKPSVLLLQVYACMQGTASS